MKRVLVVATVVSLVGGCSQLPAPPAGGYAVGVPVYTSTPGWPVVPPPVEVRTPSAPRPSFAPPPLVQCRRAFNGSVLCQ